MQNRSFSALAMAGAAVIGFSTANISFAQTISENFSSDPGARGWATAGNANLFHWNSANQNLEITWDSSQPNSYFCHPLGTLLTKDDDFSLSFDLRLTSFVAGVNPDKAGPFQVAVGFVNLSQAAGTNFLRGTGSDSPDLIEFSFFPDPGGAWQWGPSLTSSMIDWTGTNWSYGGFAPEALTSNDLFTVSLAYTATNRTLHTVLLRNGQPFGSPSDATTSPGFSDFRLDHVAVCTYSDAGQDPAYAGSIFAQGTIDNISVNVPLPVIDFSGQITNNVWQAQFVSRSNWFYTLERSVDLKSWMPGSATAAGNAGLLLLQDTNAISDRAFYRVNASRL